MQALRRPRLVVIIGRESDRDKAPAIVASADPPPPAKPSIRVVFRHEKTGNDSVNPTTEVNSAEGV